MAPTGRVRRRPAPPHKGQCETRTGSAPRPSAPPAVILLRTSSPRSGTPPNKRECYNAVLDGTNVRFFGSCAPKRTGSFRPLPAARLLRALSRHPAPPSGVSEADICEWVGQDRHGPHWPNVSSKRSPRPATRTTETICVRVRRS